ncbi:alpha-1,2-mannosyltransferase ALG9 [Asbolus verrucosus]|uniref:Mannosyltransferase n=1 Tax=Asbolus verrucosus TaxID=1661398 RepID=A0A482VF57_ASBVE|nr:alpha-1,2-mannosyltransferase ALG9 [Asbolus verrucosus]
MFIFSNIRRGNVHFEYGIFTKYFYDVYFCFSLRSMVATKISFGYLLYCIGITFRFFKYAVLGWPFAALLGVPIAYDMLVRRKLYVDFFAWSVIAGSAVILPMLIIDSMHFGRIVIAPLNIIVYNVFGGAGPNLYGTEPFTFYLLNGFINFNFVWILALMCPLAVLLGYFFVPARNRRKDWHRYPSSFFLPNNNWNVRFVKSEFKGMLPAPYSAGSNATYVVHEHFNDKNEEEPSLYFNLNKCHFLLDLDLGKETDLEPIYAKMKDRWKVIKSYKFLNAEKSNSFFRTFYVPILTDKYVQYGNFSLLQSTKLRIK